MKKTPYGGNKFSKTHVHPGGKKVVCMCGRSKKIDKLLLSGKSGTDNHCKCGKKFPTTEEYINILPTSASRLVA